MLINLVNTYTLEKERIKLSIEFSEMVLLSMWKYMKQSELFESELETFWLKKFIENYNGNNEKFVDVLVGLIEFSDGIPIYNKLENRILCFEILGFLTVYGNFLLDTDKIIMQSKYTSTDIANLLFSLLNNNYGFLYLVYDNNAIEVSMLLLFSLRLNKIDDLKKILKSYVVTNLNEINSKKFPILERQYAIALEVEYSELDYTSRYVASYFWGLMREWSIMLKMNDVSKLIQNNKLLEDVTVQNWDCNSTDELGLFDINEAQHQGASLFFEEFTDEYLEKIFLDQSIIDEFDTFSFIKYSFPTIGLILSRKNRVPVIPNYWRKQFVNNKIL